MEDPTGEYSTVKFWLIDITILFPYYIMYNIIVVLGNCINMHILSN